MTRLTLLVLLTFLSLTSYGRSRSGGVIFFGDWGQGTRDQKVVAAGIGNYCRQDGCDFVLALGDNFYPSGVSSVTDPQWKTKFHDVYDFLGLRFYASLGNHDYYGGHPEAEVAYSRVSSRWMMPANYYEFTYGDAHYFAIDTEKFTSTQALWLKAKLDAAKETWKIVYGHHPIYSSGWHGNSGSLARDLLPILRNRADLYLAGHDHHKEAIQAEAGVNFFISGAAAENRGVKASKSTLFSSSTLGFSHLLVQGPTARVRFLDQTGKVEWETTLKKASARRAAKPVFP